MYPYPCFSDHLQAPTELPKEEPKKEPSPEKEEPQKEPSPLKEEEPRVCFTCMQHAQEITCHLNTTIIPIPEPWCGNMCCSN